MVAAMVLGGLRRCEVLGLRLPDLRFAERRVFVADGKGGHQRLIPVSMRLAYLYPVSGVPALRLQVRHLLEAGHVSQVSARTLNERFDAAEAGSASARTDILTSLRTWVAGRPTSKIDPTAKAALLQALDTTIAAG